MILAWLIDSSSAVGLDKLSAKYFDHNMIAFKDVVKKGQDFSSIDVDKACEYAAEDALITYKLYFMLIEKLKEDADKLGIDGLVYEMISWEKKYDRSVLAVSSDWIKAIVVKDFSTLLGIAEFARSKKLPKLKIIPLDAIPKFKFTVPDKPGIIGVLSNFVKCDDAYSPLKTFLFGNIILTETRESAYNLSQLGYKSVTLDGEYFEAKGGAVVIDINSKISKLTKLISMSSDIDGLFQSISLIKRYMLKKKHSLKITKTHFEQRSITKSEVMEGGGEGKRDKQMLTNHQKKMIFL